MCAYICSLFQKFAGITLLLLAIEFIDELVDGYRGSTWPAIKDALALSYTQIGLLLSVPHVVGCVIEIGFGVLADRGYRRNIILCGGVLFAFALVGIAVATSFSHLMIALLVFYPAAGAFVSVAQTALMDLHPTRTEQMMARWTVAGSLSHLFAPMLFVALAGLNQGWRYGYLLIGILTMLIIWILKIQSGWCITREPQKAAEVSIMHTTRASLRVVGSWRVLKWLLALELSNLLLDVFIGFLALYLVSALRFGEAQAAFVLFVVACAALAGEVLLVIILERVSGLNYLKLSATAAAVVYILFLNAHSVIAVYLLASLVSITTAGWHAVLQGNLYKAFSGQTSLVVSANAVAGLFAGVIPAALGVIADKWGITTTMWLLSLAPLAVFAVTVEHTRGMVHGPASTTQKEESKAEDY